MTNKDIKDIKKLREDLKILREQQEKFNKCYTVAHQAYCIVDNYIGDIQKENTERELLKTVINLLEPKHRDHFKKYIEVN